MTSCMLHCFEGFYNKKCLNVKLFIFNYKMSNLEKGQRMIENVQSFGLFN